MNCLSHLLFLLFADMAGSSRFAKAVRATPKSKVVPTRVASPSAKRAHHLEVVIVLPPPIPQPAAEETALESLAPGASASASAPTDIPSPSIPTPTSVRVESS